jgi:hypothetical protein
MSVVRVQRPLLNPACYWCRGAISHPVLYPETTFSPVLSVQTKENCVLRAPQIRLPHEIICQEVRSGVAQNDFAGL